MDWNKRKLEGHSVPVQNKKPYYGDVRPGQEYQEPRLYQQPNYSFDDAGRKVSSIGAAAAWDASYLLSDAHTRDEETAP
jgi:hypothetical protein